MSYNWDNGFARLRKRLGAQHPRPYHNEVPYRVPGYLKELDPSQYTPHTVSLGLNTRIEPGLEYYKAEIQRCFLKWKTQEANYRALHQKPDHEGNDLGVQSGAAVVYAWEQFIEDLELDTDVLTANLWYQIDYSPVKPIVYKTFLALDALFLIIFLRYSYYRVPHLRPKLPEDVYKQLEGQAVYRLLCQARSGIWRDVFLFENQIPLHILTKVWNLMPDMECKEMDEKLQLFNQLLREVMKDRYLELFESSTDDGPHAGQTLVRKALSDKNFLEADHLLDCLHYVVCYSPGRTQKDKPVLADEKAFAPANSIPSATQLRKVGIRLNSDGCTFIHQIKFVNSFWGGPVLHLPRLCICDRTGSVLRNLAVFEMVSSYQSSLPRVGYRVSTITSFLFLMDKLIQSKRDVSLMRGSGIIINCLGSNEEMSDVWSSLCKRFSLSQHPEWSGMLKNLTSRYKNSWHQLFAEFKDKYFARPWIVVSWVAGILLLALTGMQSTYAVAAYYKSSSNHQ